MAWHADEASPADHVSTSFFEIHLHGGAACESASVPTVFPLQKDAPADPDLDLEHLIGRRLRQWRHAHRWTLDHLAGKTGVSRAMLGQIELGRSAPTVRILARIAAGLGIEVTTLIAPARPRMHVLKPPDPAAPAPDPAPLLRTLGTDPSGTSAFHAIRLPPGGTASYPDTTRAGRVNAVVARGTVQVTAGGQTLTLDEDDALEVDTAAPLHWRNAGEQAALVHAVWSWHR